MRAAIIETSALLPRTDVENAWELVDAGEPGVALELLCTQLYEHDVDVESTTLGLIRDLSEKMGLDAKYWRALVK